MSAFTTKPRILIIDDHLLFAEGIKAILSSLTDAANIHLITDPAHFVRQLDHQQQYDLVVVDLQMPGVDGMSIIDKAVAHNPDIRILIVSATQDIGVLQKAISKGARGFVSKISPAPVILDAVKQVIKGGHFHDPHFPNIAHAALNELSGNVFNIPPRTLEVLQQVAKGHSNKLIAELLSITEATVKWHVSQLFELLSVKSRTSCIARAAQLGLINIGE